MNSLIIAEQSALVTDTALRKSGRMADAMLMEIAEQGDGYALEVARQLPITATAKIVREHDFTVPSILGLLCEPEDVASFFAQDPQTWTSVDANNVDDIVRDVRDIVTSVILSKDDVQWQSDVFDAIAQSDEAMMYLAVAFVGYVSAGGTDKLSFVFNDKGDGTIYHLYRSMCECNPKVAEHLTSIVCGDDRHWHHGDEFALVQEMHERANAMEETEDVKEMFSL